MTEHHLQLHGQLGSNHEEANGGSGVEMKSGWSELKEVHLIRTLSRQRSQQHTHTVPQASLVAHDESVLD